MFYIVKTKRGCFCYIIASSQRILTLDNGIQLNEYDEPHKMFLSKSGNFYSDCRNGWFATPTQIINVLKSHVISVPQVKIIETNT